MIVLQTAPGSTPRTWGRDPGAEIAEAEVVISWKIIVGLVTTTVKEETSGGVLVVWEVPLLILEATKIPSVVGTRPRGQDLTAEASPALTGKHRIKLPYFVLYLMSGGCNMILTFYESLFTSVM